MEITGDTESTTTLVNRANFQLQNSVFPYSQHHWLYIFTCNEPWDWTRVVIIYIYIYIYHLHHHHHHQVVLLAQSSLTLFHHLSLSSITSSQSSSWSLSELIFLIKHKIVQEHNPPYSPDLHNFFLFLKLKIYLKGNIWGHTKLL